MELAARLGLTENPEIVYAPELGNVFSVTWEKMDSIYNKNKKYVGKIIFHGIRTLMNSGGDYDNYACFSVRSPCDKERAVRVAVFVKMEEEGDYENET